MDLLQAKNGSIVLRKQIAKYIFILSKLSEQLLLILTLLSSVKKKKLVWLENGWVGWDSRSPIARKVPGHPFLKFCPRVIA